MIFLALAAISIVPAFMLFKRSYMLCTALATGPIMDVINEFCPMTPLMSKLVNFALFGLGIWFSLNVGEVIIALTALAFSKEIIHWVKVIYNAWKKHYG